MKPIPIVGWIRIGEWMRESMWWWWCGGVVWEATHQEESLYFGDGLPQTRTQVVSHSGQQEAKHGNAYQRVADTEQLATLRLGRDVTEP